MSDRQRTRRAVAVFYCSLSLKFVLLYVTSQCIVPPVPSWSKFGCHLHSNYSARNPHHWFSIFRISHPTAA